MRWSTSTPLTAKACRPALPHGLLHRLRQCSERMAACAGLDELLQTALRCLCEALGIQHAWC